MNALRFFSGIITCVVSFVLILPVLLIGFPFWLMGGLYTLVVRMFGYAEAVIQKSSKTYKPLPGRWHQLDSIMQYEPLIGWKPKPGLQTYSQDKAGNKYILTTDAEGWRNVHHQTENADVVVFGDSFAFGYGANDQDFFANLITDPRIKTFGTNGYSLVQELLLMEQYSPLLSSKTIIWLIYHGNDLYENLTPNRNHYRMPFVREINGTNNWELVTKHVNPEPWNILTDRNYRGKLAEICSDTFLSRRAFAACDYLIERGKVLCERLNAPLVIFSIPDKSQINSRRITKLAGLSPNKDTFDENKPDRELEAICIKHAVPFYALKDYLNSEDLLEKDSHWNKQGNRKVAGLIRDVHLKHGFRQAAAKKTITV